MFFAEPPIFFKITRFWRAACARFGASWMIAFCYHFFCESLCFKPYYGPTDVLFQLYRVIFLAARGYKFELLKCLRARALFV